LVLIDISSFPAITPRYISPAYPPLCIAAILSIGLFLLKTENISNSSAKKSESISESK
jgi:hypothetical protein